MLEFGGRAATGFYIQELRSPHSRGEGGRHIIDKTAVTQVFDVLGPEGVGRGLAARRHRWSDCFLALAYGARGELDRAVDDGLRGAARVFRPPMAVKVAKLLGVSPGAVVAVVDAFDRASPEFRRLAEEWLEENKVGASAAGRPPERGSELPPCFLTAVPL